MSVPAAGWLATADNTNQAVERAPLPERHVISYGDGAQGTYEAQEVVTPFDILSLSLGLINTQGDAGYIGNDYGFLVEVEQLDAYGVLLLDMIDPPDIVREEEEAETPVLVTEGCPSNEAFDSIEACCSVFTDWLFNGETLFNGSRTFGAIP